MTLNESISLKYSKCENSKRQNGNNIATGLFLKLLLFNNIFRNIRRKTSIMIQLCFNRSRCNTFEIFNYERIIWETTLCKGNNGIWNGKLKRQILRQVLQDMSLTYLRLCWMSYRSWVLLVTIYLANIFFCKKQFIVNAVFSFISKLNASSYSAF